MAVLGLGASEAQTLAKIGGPRETPPDSFTDQTYIDSRGCVFLRAGYGGQVNWVPRVTRDRKAMCGYAPTFAAKPALPAPVQQAVVPPDTPQRPARAAPGMPIDTIASLTTPPALRATAVVPPSGAKAAPVAFAQTATAAAPQPDVTARPVDGIAVPRVAPGTRISSALQLGPGQVGCFTAVPVAQRLRTTDGGTVVLCTRGDGSLEGMRAPIYARVASGAGAQTGSDVRYAPGRLAAVKVMTVHPVAVASAPQVPAGYKAAWSDDRLNPRRGIGTAAGQAQQDMVWTRQVPARLVPASRVARQVVVSIEALPAVAVPQRVQVSSKSSPAIKGIATQNRLFVQIGTFGLVANAQAVKARLRGVGQPVAGAEITKGGKTLQIVLTGPFASKSDAQVALAAARRAGFGDAFIR